MQRFMPLLKALADENRVRIVAALNGRELCVCQLTALFDLATSTVSQHLAQLRHAGLVAARRRGKWVYYRRPAAGADPAVDATLAYLDSLLGEDGQAHADIRRLKDICAVDPKVLCRTAPRSES